MVPDTIFFNYSYHSINILDVGIMIVFMVRTKDYNYFYNIFIGFVSTSKICFIFTAFKSFHIKELNTLLFTNYNSMRKPITLFTFLIILSLSTFAQSGVVLENSSMTSKILDGDRNYSIYLPSDYANGNRSYPVLYLLHGAGGFLYEGNALVHIAMCKKEIPHAYRIVIEDTPGHTGELPYRLY